MPTSINGWPVLDNPAWGDARLRKDIVPEVGTTLWVRDETWPFFAALVADYHHRVNKVRVSDGYDYRPSRVPGAGWSCHSAGTAIDINADGEGAQGTGWTSWWLTAGRNLRAQRIRRRYRIVDWGAWTKIADDPHTDQVEGWSEGYADAMHWQLRKGTTVADVKRECERLRIGKDGIRRRRDGSPVYAT